MATMVYRCLQCQDQRWVCADHPAVPWGEGEGCCDAEGVPCPACNTGSPPDNPPGFTVIADAERRQ